MLRARVALASPELQSGAQTLELTELHLIGWIDQNCTGPNEFTTRRADYYTTNHMVGLQGIGP